MCHTLTCESVVCRDHALITSGFSKTHLFYLFFHVQTSQTLMNPKRTEKENEFPTCSSTLNTGNNLFFYTERSHPCEPTTSERERKSHKYCFVLVLLDSPNITIKQTTTSYDETYEKKRTSHTRQNTKKKIFDDFPQPLRRLIILPVFHCYSKILYLYLRKVTTTIGMYDRKKRNIRTTDPDENWERINDSYVGTLSLTCNQISERFSSSKCSTLCDKTRT